MFKTLTGYCICKNCQSEAEVDTSVTLTSYPPMYSYKCNKCGNSGFIYTDEVKYDFYNEPVDPKPDISLDPKLLKKIEELEKRIEALEANQGYKFEEKE